MVVVVIQEVAMILYTLAGTGTLIIILLIAIIVVAVAYIPIYPLPLNNYYHHHLLPPPPLLFYQLLTTLVLQLPLLEVSYITVVATAVV